MEVIDPGHEYLLDSLDGESPNRLVFVKREGAKYPGNVGHHPGTTTQEVIRALIDRLSYVNRQSPCVETCEAASHLIRALVLLERRAARIHRRKMSMVLAEDIISGLIKCPRCGHVGCAGYCQQ